jgi:flagellar hook-length control protein FliK
VDPAKVELLVPGSEKTENFTLSGNALMDQMAQALPGLSHKALAGDAKSGAAANLAESKMLAQASFADVAAREPVLSSALLASGLGEGLMRQADRTVNKLATQPAGLGVEGIWGQSVFQAGNRVDMPSVAIDPTTQPFETTVAETVSYWATHGVQNAELKIDGAGGESIAVSISLRGDEAHIGFRTDQLETRQMLEGAVAHLKELLTNEGLVLSGVSVGASGQDKTGAQDQRNQPGARQATLVSTENAPVEIIPRANKTGASALDLYV